jgi:tRNA(Ile2) C34 agmatinyltransferase TiaS
MEKVHDEIRVCLYCRKSLNGKGTKGFCCGKEIDAGKRLDIFMDRCFSNYKANGERF